MTNKITVMSFARVAEPREYADIALGEQELPVNHQLQYINHLGERTAKDALEAVEGSNLILCSGSALDVGKFNQESGEVEPDFQEKTVRELVLFFEFLLIQSYQGNPAAEKYLVLANCFSAQSLAFAMVLVDALIEAKADLSAIKSIEDLNKLHPPEQTWTDQKPAFPIVKTRDTQLGLMKSDITAPHHWIFDQMDHQRGLLYVHNQAILLEVLEGLQHIRPQILAKRDLAVFQQDDTPVKGVVDLFSYSGPQSSSEMLAAQPHLDYGKSLKNLINVLKKAMNKPQFAKLFRPGTGGAYPNGSQRSVEELLIELVESAEDKNGHQAIKNCLNRSMPSDLNRAA
ncbi:hypothetical protein IT411_01155 [Candidatus Peregrinibacteria bacterium]|nr:hypothetical protein [Candidatus Peregrinibacteria bacterium]